MKGAPRRGIRVTSSLNEMSTDQLENRVVAKEEKRLLRPSLTLSTAGR
jgi:hypothetical protein